VRSPPTRKLKPGLRMLADLPPDAQIKLMWRFAAGLSTSFRGGVLVPHSPDVVEDALERSGREDDVAAKR